MRRAKKVAVPEEEEEEELDFDEDMDDMEDEMAGMTLEDLLSPEEIQALTELITAVVSNDLEQCKKLLAQATATGMKKEILLNAPAPETGGTSALMLAFEAGNYEMAKFFLENGGEASTVNEEGESCFSIACAEGHVKLVELLLEKGAVKLFGPIDDAGNGALHIAAGGHIDTLRLLLDKGAFINVPTAESKSTALHMAVVAGKVDNVRLLLEKGADVGKLTAAGLTPLMCACEGLEPAVAIEVATLLLNGKADVNKAAPFGSTAYDIAAAEGSFHLARFLLEHGAVPKGVPSNTVGIDGFSVQPYYQVGDVPCARTRGSSIVLGDHLYMGGGLRTRSVQELEAEIMATMSEEGAELDESNMMPFAALSDIYTADLTKISQQPLVADLSKLKASFGATINLSKQLKGEHLSVDDSHVVSVKFEADCCSHDEEGKPQCVAGDDECTKDEEEHDFVTSILAEEGFTAEKTPIAYYEVTLLSESEISPAFRLEVSVGLTSEAGEWEFMRHAGWTISSIGYHSDDGRARVLVEDEEQDIPWVGQPYGLGDTVGVGYIFATKETFFTLNGRFMGIPLSDEEFSGEEVRPVIGVATNGLKFKANFGLEPFRFNFHVPTISWKKLKDLPNNIVSLLPLPGSTEEMLVITDSTKAVYHYNPVTEVVQVKECKAGKLTGIPLHAEHVVQTVGNKVVVFVRQEALLEPGKRKNGLLFVLDLATHTWTDILAPIGMAQKKLSKALTDMNAVLSAGVLGGNFYIFSPEKAYQLNLANLTLTAIKIANLPPNEDIAFTPLEGDANRSLAYGLGPSMNQYRFNVLDIAAKQWYVPRFALSLLEPLVGRAMAAHNGKYFVFGGFTSVLSTSRNYFWSFTNQTGPARGLAAAFDDATYSDFSVVVGARTLSLHKAILAARSSVFAALFAASPELATYTVPAELHAESAIAALKYLYSDSIDITLVSAKDHKTVLAAAIALAPNQERRLMEELLFTHSLTRSTLDADLVALKDQFADLTVEANGGSFKAHRVILASRSAALKEKISGNSLKLEHSLAATQTFAHALYAICSFNLASVPRTQWDELLTIGKALNTCCLDKAILAAQAISVNPDDAPLAV
jgi:ankyrin repeat protein